MIAPAPSSRRPHAVGALTALAVAATTLCGASVAHSQGEIVPTGFTFEPVIVNVFEPGRPVAFAQLPDERFLIIERNTAKVRIHPVGGTTAPVILTVPNVTIEAERGLLGVAVDPDWPTRPYVYLFSTHTGSVAYLTMYTASGDLTDPRSVSVTLADPFDLLTDLPDLVDIHNGGTLRFGPDGMLYLSLGDDANPCNAQNLGSPAGGILRLDVSAMPGIGPGPPPKADITPSDNPFPGPDEFERLVYAWGMRNPFRFTIDSKTNDLVVGDVGLATMDEVDLVPYAAGGGLNFGWPHREGTFDPMLGFTCGIANTFTDPIYTYDHLAAASIVAGPTYRVSAAAQSFPAAYDGSIFVTEFWHSWIRRLVFDGSDWVTAPPVAGQPNATDWGSSFYYMADFQMGADGALYLMRLIPAAGRSSGLYRIVFSGATSAPEAVASVAAVDAYPNPTSGGARIRWSGRSQVAPRPVRIYDATGRLVRLLGPARSGFVDWDGRDDRGGPLPAGVYFYALDGEPAYAGKIVRIR